MDKNNQIEYYLIHCEEHNERLPHIQNIRWTVDKDIEIFKGYYTKRNSIEYVDQMNYLKQIDPNLSLPKDGDIKEYYPHKGDFSCFWSTGEMGCYLSHHMLIKHISDTYNGQNGQNLGHYSVIFEDDVIIDKSINSQIQTIIDSLKYINWDIIFLGNLNNNHKTHIVNNIYTLDKDDYCWGTHGLLINNKNAKKIYEQTCQIKRQIDNQYKILIDYDWLDGLVIYPPICVQCNQLPSTIQGTN